MMMTTTITEKVREAQQAGVVPHLHPSVLHVTAYKLAISFHHAQLWRILQDSVRNIIMQFGMVSAICFCTLLSYTPVFRDAHADLERLSCEGSFGGSSVFILFFGGDMQSWQIIFAIMPAFMLLVLFFFDHNVSFSFTVTAV